MAHGRDFPCIVGPVRDGRMIVLNAQQLQRLAESLLRLERQLEEAGADASHVREGLDEVASRVGVHLQIARLASPDTLLGVVSPGERKDSGKLWAVGEVLYLDGVRALAEGDPVEARGSWEKARLLLEHVEPGLDLPDDAASPRERVRDLDQWLRDR